MYSYLKFIAELYLQNILQITFFIWISGTYNKVQVRLFIVMSLRLLQILGRYLLSQKMNSMNPLACKVFLEYSRLL